MFIWDLLPDLIYIFTGIEIFEIIEYYYDKYISKPIKFLLVIPIRKIVLKIIEYFVINYSSFISILIISVCLWILISSY